MSTTSPTLTSPDTPSMLPITSITPGRYNRSPSEDGLAEMTESIRAVGVIEPIIVRPLVQLSTLQMADWQSSGNALPEWEIVCGERRWRGATRAGLTHIPCLVRSLDDAQAAEIQLHENLEREGLNALDEGITMRNLIQQHSMTVDALTARTGKSRSHVYARIRLAERLDPYAQALLRSGELDAETALLVSRIPNPKLQIQAATDVLGQSYRAARDIIRNRYSTDLTRSAGWDLADAKLVESAGPCTTCPHRSGNDPTDTDSGNPDVCTSPDCFAAKRLAHWRCKLHAEWEVKGYQTIEVESALMTGAYRSSVDRSSRHGLAYHEMAERLEGAAWLQPYQARTLFTAALIRASISGPVIVQIISHESAIRLEREYSLYLDAHKPTPSTAAQARAEAPPEGEGDDDETSVATPRDRSHEEPGPLTRGEGERTEGGHGLTAMGRSAEVDALVLKALRYRGKAEVVDLRWICAALVGQVGPATLRAIGIPEPGCGRSYEERISATLAERSPDELARIALACAIDMIECWSPSGDDLRLIKMRLDQPVEPADADTSQSVDAGLTADDDPDVDESAPRTRRLKRSIKYRHPTTGETWSGKGLQPAWFKREMDAGRSISEFEVAA